MEENEFIQESARRLEQWENTPRPRVEDYDDMSREEMAKLLVYLTERLQESERLRAREHEEASSRIAELTLKVGEMGHTIAEMASVQRASVRQIAELTAAVKSKDELIARLQSEGSVSRKERFGSKSQKGIRSRKRKNDNTPTPHTDAKGDFDGTPESLPENLDVDQGTAADATADAASLTSPKECRLNRLGMTYRTMSADREVCHSSDRSKLPEGAVIIKTYQRYAYDQQTTITEHSYEIVVYKDKDGQIRSGYFPLDESEPIIESVPGTHASAELLSHLVFNRFFLDTPVYRETERLLQEYMRVSRQTITNWLEKGAECMKGIIEYLKDHCLEKDSFVNCDETWCRVKMRGDGKYRKAYVWCLVNKKAKTAIYCYEDGSRGRKALKHILEGRQIRALQTDGYNVYLYLDKEVMDIEHLCCMAHMRAYFVNAHDVEHDKYALLFLEYIGRLYAFEERYQKQHLSPEQIKYFRNSPETMEVIIGMRSLLDKLRSENAPRRGYLMEKALNYLYKFWDQLFRYLRDGEYTIDNNLAERCIRPLANERKNSLFFGSDKMARVSAAYHSVVSTCKLQGYSILEYLKKFFAEITAGNRDYGKLMPSTIGISANKL